MQDINGRVTKSVIIGSNYEYKNENVQICVLPSVAKMKVDAVLVSSTKAFLTTGPALQVEVPMEAASIPDPKVREECWNSSLNAWLEVEEVSILEVVVARIQPDAVAVAATSKPAQQRETFPTASRVLDPYKNPVT
jgi:hypothetical protein